MAATRANKGIEQNFDVEHEDEFISKTQIKAQALEQQKLGVSLIDLSQAELAKIPMDSELLDAVLLARKIRQKKEGYRRQLQFIGKLMRSRDTAPIEQAMLVIKSAHKKQNNEFHKLEQLRDDILVQGDSKIESALAEYPSLDRQKLRQLVRQAKKQKSENKAPKAARELFKYLKDTIIG
jgi:ribosome-associated protein